MQGLSAKGGERGSGVLAELSSFGLEAAAIDVVAEERMPDRGEVDADLVGAPGLEPAGDEARHRRAPAAPGAVGHPPMGDRRPPPAPRPPPSPPPPVPAPPPLLPPP